MSGRECKFLQPHPSSETVEGSNEGDDHPSSRRHFITIDENPSRPSSKTVSVPSSPESLGPANVQDGDRADAIDRGIVSAIKAEELFEHYVRNMAPHLPFVVFPPHTVASDVRRSRPLLFLAILGAAAGTCHHDIQRTLTKEAFKIYADCLVGSGAKTLELVQAMLVSSIWYWIPDRWKEVREYELAHMAAVVGMEMGLGRKMWRPRCKYVLPGSSKLNLGRPSGYPDPETLESRRTWLGCYFVSCCVSISHKRHNLIKWDSFIEDSLRILEASSKSHSSDKVLCEWVRNQHLLEEIAFHYGSDDPTSRVDLDDPRTQYFVKGFESGLERWTSRTFKDFAGPTLDLAGHFVNIYLHEVFMQIDNYDDDRENEDMDLNGSRAPHQDKLSSAHVAAVSSCRQSITSTLNIFLQLDASTFINIPTFHLGRLVSCLVLLIKMDITASSPQSNLGTIIQPEDLRAACYINRLTEHFRSLISQDKSRKTYKFLVVLMILRKWYLQQTPEPHHGASSDADQINAHINAKIASMPPHPDLYHDCCRGVEVPLALDDMSGLGAAEYEQVMSMMLADGSFDAYFGEAFGFL